MNYTDILESIIIKEQKENKIPTLLLHSCCAPCSSYVLEYLSNYFKITVLYYNPNIYPEEEYSIRRDEQQKFIKDLKTKHPVSFLEIGYNDNSYYNAVKGLESEKEGGLRCYKCYQLRLEQTATLAKELKFDYFTTTLSVSPYKNSLKINEIGAFLSEKYQINYLYADFKKKNGYKRSIELSKEYNLYRQNYCGCIYSMKKGSI